jgi:hypothetical protein
MKLAAVTAAIAVAVLAPRSADACGVPDLGMILTDVVRAFETKTTPVRTPVVVAGGATSTAGRVATIGVGYAWGKKEQSWLFPGSRVQRVLLNLRTDARDNTAVAATYGWYQNHLVSLGLDVGAEAELTGLGGVGPTARAMVGVRGIGVQLTGGMMFGGEQTHHTAAAAVVVDVMDLTGVL